MDKSLDRISTKDNRYSDISWLMPAVDVVSILEVLNVKISSVTGDEVRAFCPDHHLFVGRESSDPNWFCNTVTGLTNCMTEPRGSNLLWTVVRLLGCPPEEAVRVLTGCDANIDQLYAKNCMLTIEKALKGVEPVQPPLVFGLDDVGREIEKRPISDRLYSYFWEPPNKSATSISKETVDYYRVFERTWGKYEGRAIIPIFQKRILTGYCAIDIVGEAIRRKKWSRSDNFKYKKVLYPANLPLRNTLFGIDDCNQGEGAIYIVEGARDVMKMKQEGFSSTVGIMKLDISDGQIKLLAEKTPRQVIVFLDGDKRGEEASSLIKAKLSDVFSVKIAFAPDGLDPKNMNKGGMMDTFSRLR